MLPLKDAAASPHNQTATLCRPLWSALKRGQTFCNKEKPNYHTLPQKLVQKSARQPNISGSLIASALMSPITAKSLTVNKTIGGLYQPTPLS
jgi:hypothetical protein